MSAAAKFGLWATPQTTVEVEYSLAVLEEIRRAVLDGMHRLSRGMEVGGILFGVDDGGKLRIEALREIACEHAFGPSFQLSELDKTTLTAQLADAAADTSLRGLSPLGWFVSHPRRDLALQPPDLEIFRQFFPEAKQVTLVIRPGRGGNMRGGFFIREPDGTLKTDRSHLDFTFPDSGPVPIPPGGSSAFNRPAREERTADRPLDKAFDRSWAPDPPLPASPLSDNAPSGTLLNDVRSFGEPPPQGAGNVFFGLLTPRSKLGTGLGAAGLALAILAAAFAIPRFLGGKEAPDPIALSVLDQSGQLRIQWNHESKTVAKALYGALEVTDGGDHKTVSLTPQDLAHGNYTYARRTGDVQVRLSVASASGQKSQEASRYLGSGPGSNNDAEPSIAPVAAAPALPETDTNSPRLSDLRSENARLRARTQQLERTLVILQGRLGMSQDKTEEK